MTTNYEHIIRENLQEVFDHIPLQVEQCLAARRKDSVFLFTAFGEDCLLGPDEIMLSGQIERGPKGVVISLYARHAHPGPAELEPWRAFKDLPGSMPYQGAFRTYAERILIPYVPQIEKQGERIARAFGGAKNPAGVEADLSLLLYPFPKIALCYVFYMGDEEFPPSVSCLFSSNALSFMPLDGLADLAEYTSMEIIRQIEAGE
jgi:hypothetical protein